ncbi:hypothetical protein QF042_001946 [Pedobacter sp. W3I1]|uniref:DUF5627 domain-containing protein n=1 Tax=Pedobacter sp. W3I1 TaxID=3042291 RepID=UPI0027815F62|nr:DUF5627 domain-containing protein [Pedobacter sp. W3I1]MDQ0638381.1 hypothetical protein [Pedobacter sp. W3I1]
MKINHICLGLAAAIGLLSSCKNDDLAFPDYAYKAVYFANQYPLRTVVLGEDLLVDNTLDNEHKVSIKATLGGVNENKEKVTIGVKVDESLLDGLNFTNGGSEVLALPSAYYKLGSSQIFIEPGSVLGGVDVQLTDAFFADPKSLTRNYVIPLVMTSVNGADSILKGMPAVNSPSRFVAANWITRPKDYVLYAVKYVNPWQGNYLRKGVDQITQSNGAVSTVARRTENVESNQVVSISTTSLKVATLPLTIKNSSGNNVNFSLVLNFADGNNCTIAANSTDFDISGSGKFVSKGEKNSIGGTERSAIYLDYTVNFKNLSVKYATKDTLIVRERGIKAEYFDVVKN